MVPERDPELDAESGTMERPRVFTGVGTIVPDPELPEHLAYPKYRDELLEHVVHLQNGVARRERQVQAARDEAHEAVGASHDARSRLGLVRWMVCTERRRAAQAHRSVELLTSRLYDVELHYRTAVELSAVQVWLG